MARLRGELLKQAFCRFLRILPSEEEQKKSPYPDIETRTGLVG